MTDIDQASAKMASTASKARMIDGQTVIRNAFNNETFVFSGALGDLHQMAFDVILEAGGTGGGNALGHVHPMADETFIVTAGRLKVVMAGNEQFFEAGQTITVPRGTPHWFANAGREAMTAIVSFDPPQQHVRFFRNFAMLTQQRPQWFSGKGDPKMLLIALVLNAYRDHMYLAGSPIWLQKFAFTMLARVARWRGYNLSISPSASGPE